MKNKKIILLMIFIIFILSSCGKKSYVVFDYNCNGQEYHKCELKNNKLNCKVETPICGEYKFTGWHKANEYKNQVDLNGTFNKNEIIYARWEENGQVIESSSQELVSTIIPPDVIDMPSSSKIEYSSQIIEEPSSQKPTPVPEATYTILFNANGGSGGQSSQISGVKYDNDLPAINQTKPTKTGYTFTGWYDSQIGGTQYYNSSNSPVRKYDKKNNITLYAQWRVNVLTIQYNGNGGTWISTNSRFGVNSSGTVIEKSTGKIYSKEINYGSNTESSGLTDYNGSWFKWKKDGYSVESKKEYFLQNGSIKNTLDQNKVYSAADLAKYSGCDLSKNDCTITVKVNWKKVAEPIKPSADENVVISAETDTLKVYITKESNYYFLTRIWAQNPYMQFNKQDANPYGKTRVDPEELLQAAVKEKNLKNKLIIGFNASGFFEEGNWGTENVINNPIVNRTSVGTVLITNGKVIRNTYEIGDLDTWFITGIDKNNKMVIFEDTKMEETNPTEKKAWADKVIASGIRNTYTFSAPIILDGKKAPYKDSYYYMPDRNNSTPMSLQLFCQIDDNNFALFTTKNKTRNQGIALFLKLGCKTAVNLDGGGSIAILFKAGGSTEIRTVIGAQRRLVEIGYVSEL